MHALIGICVAACVLCPDALQLPYMHWRRVWIMISTHDKPLLNSLVGFTLCQLRSELALLTLSASQCHCFTRTPELSSLAVALLFQPGCRPIPRLFIPVLGHALVLKGKFGSCWKTAVRPLIAFSFSTQETLEDIDKNGDGHVDEDEYIGEFSRSSDLKVAPQGSAFRQLVPSHSCPQFETCHCGAQDLKLAATALISFHLYRAVCDQKPETESWIVGIDVTRR